MENLSYFTLTLAASGLIYAGSHEGLEITPSTEASTTEHADPDARREVEIQAPINSSEAWLMPILGSLALLSLWLMLRYLNANVVRLIFAIYFAMTGTFSVWATLVAIMRKTLGSSYLHSFKLRRLNLHFPYFGELDLRFRTPTAILAVLSIIPSVLYMWERGPDGFEPSLSHALLNDTIAASLAFGVMKILQLDGFPTACILLTGLFFYDIWWVFATPVMVDVARGLDAPVLLLWPRSLAFEADAGFSMLGLGDIVLPGSFVATCLRYDYYSQATTRTSPDPNSERSNLLPAAPSAVENGRPFKKPYFRNVLVAYLLGLNVTSAMVQIFNTAQPALLYLSPACIGAFLLTAWHRNELRQVWQWRFEPKSSSSPARPDEAVEAIEADVPVPVPPPVSDSSSGTLQAGPGLVRAVRKRTPSESQPDV